MHYLILALLGFRLTLRMTRTKSVRRSRSGIYIDSGYFFSCLIKAFALLQTVVGSIKYASLLQWEKVATRVSEASEVVDG